MRTHAEDVLCAQCAVEQLLKLNVETRAITELPWQGMVPFIIWEVSAVHQVNIPRCQNLHLHGDGCLHCVRQQRPLGLFYIFTWRGQNNYSMTTIGVAWKWWQANALNPNSKASNQGSAPAAWSTDVEDPCLALLLYYYDAGVRVPADLMPGWGAACGTNWRSTFKFAGGIYLEATHEQA